MQNVDEETFKAIKTQTTLRSIEGSHDSVRIFYDPSRVEMVEGSVRHYPENSSKGETKSSESEAAISTQFILRTETLILRRKIEEEAKQRLEEYEKQHAELLEEYEKLDRQQAKLKRSQEKTDVSQKRDSIGARIDGFEQSKPTALLRQSSLDHEKSITVVSALLLDKDDLSPSQVRNKVQQPFGATQKGKGYKPAEESGDKYHGVSKFNITTGEQIKSKTNTPSYTKIFAETLVKHAEQDTKIIGITGAMPDGTGMDIFEKSFPDRMFDVGIAEQHAVTFAAGLATEGYKPFAAIYSTFLQRAYDQVVHDVAIQSLPVRFAIDRAGLVGADGATHAGSFDVTYLSTLPNFIVMAASDETELVKMINTSVDINDKPSAIRYPRGTGIGLELPSIDEKIEIGKGRIVQEGKQACILSLGTRLEECKIAAEELKNKGITTTIVDARFAKPLDQELILRCAREHEVMITIEEGSIGGFGSHVKNLLAEKGVFDKGLKFRSMTLPDIFIEQDNPKKMYDIAGLNAYQISKKILDILFTKESIKVVKN